MKGFSISSEEIQELRAVHRLSHNKKHAYKINAIILLGSGWTLEEVSEALLLDHETLRKYVASYRSGGLEELLTTHYKGSSPKLTEDQIEQLCAELDQNIYPSTKAIQEYIKKTFKIKYTISGLTDLLHRLGYVYKKPKLIPNNPDIEAQSIFISQFLEFMENKPENHAVFFMDAVHPVHNTLAGYGWIRRGKSKELASNSGRSRFNIHGAMNAETLETVVISSEENVNADSTINLFEYLETLYPLAAVIYVICDNAKYHFSKEVKKWLKNSRTKLIPLPAYSPELNPIERLWKIFKKHILYNKFYETFDEFKKACLGFFEEQKKYYDEIASIMGEGLEGLV